MKKLKFKHQPTRIEMKRALYHLGKLLGMIGTIGNNVEWKDTSVVVKLGTAKRFVEAMTERMEMSA